MTDYKGIYRRILPLTMAEIGDGEHDLRGEEEVWEVLLDPEWWIDEIATEHEWLNLNGAKMVEALFEVINEGEKQISREQFDKVVLRAVENQRIQLESVEGWIKYHERHKDPSEDPTDPRESDGE